MASITFGVDILSLGLKHLSQSTNPINIIVRQLRFNLQTDNLHNKSNIFQLSECSFIVIQKFHNDKYLVNSFILFFPFRMFPCDCRNYFLFSIRTIVYTLLIFPIAFRPPECNFSR